MVIWLYPNFDAFSFKINKVHPNENWNNQPVGLKVLLNTQWVHTMFNTLCCTRAASKSEEPECKSSKVKIIRQKFKVEVLR